MHTRTHARRRRGGFWRVDAKDNGLSVSVSCDKPPLLLLLLLPPLRTEIDVVVIQQQRRVTGAGRLGAAMEPQPFVVGIIEQDGARCRCGALQAV